MQIIYKHLFGSFTYGTNNENSDRDEKGVYIAPFSDYTLGSYAPTIKINKDDEIHELSKFCNLLKESNPTTLEMLWALDENIFEELPEFSLFRKFKKEFLSKACKKTFLGMSKSQINKASGLDKLMNWEKDKITKKSILDFCYILLDREASISLKKWLEIKNLSQSDLSVSKVKNFPDVYSMYLYKSKGLTNEDESYTQLRTTEIPKEIEVLTYMRYDENAYKQHCTEYRRYLEWLNNRNEDRYVDSAKHGQKYDGKNLLHCIRILDIAEEIATTKNFTLKRENAEYLKSIRRGEMDLESIINYAQSKYQTISDAFDASDLPEEPNKDLIDEIHLAIRKTIYKQDFV